MQRGRLRFVKFLRDLVERHVEKLSDRRDVTIDLPFSAVCGIIRALLHIARASHLDAKLAHGGIQVALDSDQFSDNRVFLDRDLLLLDCLLPVEARRAAAEAAAMLFHMLQSFSQKLACHVLLSGELLLVKVSQVDILVLKELHA